MLDRIYARDTLRGMVPLSLVAVLHDYLGRHVAAQGLAPDALWPEGPSLSQALQGLDAEHALGRFPAELFCQWLARAAEHLRDPLLGLHLGQTIRPAHMGALGYVLLACDHLGAALLRLQRYHRLINDINPVRHELRPDGLELQWGTAMGRTGPLFDEMGLSAIVQFGRELSGQDHGVSLVEFVNPPPSDPRPLEAFFGCEVRFSQPITRLRLPLASLQLPLRRPDPQLLRLMESQVDAMLHRLADTEGGAPVADATRRAVALLAPQGTPTLEDVASELKLTPRVFYRRLAQEGLSFRDLREQALRQLAEMHLADTRLSLAEVALLLGYSEQSAFTRAFRRWTGLAPLQWRQARRAA